MSADAGSAGAGGPERELLIRGGGRRATPAAVNATMRRLGVDVEWSEEAVQQLAAAASAAEEYVRRHPDQAETLVRTPEVVLRALVEEGLLSGPVDALESALAATRRRVGGSEPAGTRLRVRIADPPGGTYG